MSEREMNIKKHFEEGFLKIKIKRYYIRYCN